MSHLTECKRRLFAAVVLVLAVAATVGVSGPQAEVVVSGRVVDAVTGAPVPEAVVTVSGAANETRETSNGRFAIALRNAASPVRISSTAFGYLRGFPGQRGPTDDLAGAGTIAPTAGRPSEDVVIRLWREASISGRVVDHDEEPIAGAAMVVMTQVFTGSGFRWSEARASSARTDDHGQFHIAQLQPGDYLVAVRPPVDPRAGADATPPVTYYPGTQVASEAQVVTLTSGTDARFDLTVDFRPALGDVRGRLAGADDLNGFFVHLVPERLLGAVSAFSSVGITAGMAPVGGFVARVAPDGSFAFPAVPRGAYRAMPWRPPQAGSRIAGPRPSTTSSDVWTADVPVVVENAAPVEIVVPLSAGVRVRGRLLFDAAKPPVEEEVTALSLSFRSAYGAIPGPLSDALVEADGSFTSPGLPPGDYIIGVRQQPGSLVGWTATSILAQGREVVAGTLSVGAADVEDVVIRLTDRPAMLRGTLRDSRGQPVRDGRVIVFPAMPSERDQYQAAPVRSRVVQALSDRDGNFVAPVLPGEYLIAPVAGDLPAFWMAPEHLATLTAMATEVRVPDGREVTVNITLR